MPEITAMEELSRLKKALVLADIIEAAGLEFDQFTDGQWTMVASIACTKTPSATTQAIVRALLAERAKWRRELKKQEVASRG